MTEQAGIIITVPHGSCHYHGDTTKCDSIAGDFGSYLLKDFTKKPQLSVKLLEFDSDPIIDQNLKAQRNTYYRHGLRKTATRYKTKFGNKLIHIDVHSFNPETNPDWSSYEVVLVQDEEMNGKSLSVGLSYFLSEDFKVTTYRGKNNDIHQEMLELGIPSIIVEVNEKMKAKDIINLAQQISDWLLMPKKSVITNGIYREIESGAGAGLFGGLVGAGIGFLVAGVPGAVVGGLIGGVGAAGIRSGVFSK